MKIFWPSEMRELLQQLIADTPPFYKKYVNAWGVHATEQQAEKIGKSEIDEDVVVRGYITSIPRHLRDGIHDTLSEHNIDLMYYRPVFDEPNANLKTTVPFDQIDHHDGGAKPVDSTPAPST